MRSREPLSSRVPVAGSQDPGAGSEPSSAASMATYVPSNGSPMTDPASWAVPLASRAYVPTSAPRKFTRGLGAATAGEAMAGTASAATARAVRRVVRFIGVLLLVFGRGDDGA